MKMTVLYVEATGHVVAAATRVAMAEFPAPDPASDDPAPEVAALVRDALPMRAFVAGVNGAAVVSIPAKDLAALAMDVNDDPLLAPGRYRVDDAGALQLLPGDAPPVPARNADGSVVTVMLPSAATAEVPIQLHLMPSAAAAREAQHLHGVFEPGTPTAQTIRFSVRTPLIGDWFVLVLVQGFRAALLELAP